MNIPNHYVGKRFDEYVAEEILNRHRERLLRVKKTRLFETCLVACLENDRIKRLGLNKPSDLILANFGIWLAGLIRPPTPGGETIVNLVNDAGSSIPIKTYRYSQFNFNYVEYNTDALGTVLRIGAGTTPPTYNDYTLASPFTTSPENTYFATSNGVWGAGVVSFSGSVSAGGSGTVNEVGFFARWHHATSSSSYHYFMLFRNLISPGVSFQTGNTITVSYSINLS